MPLFRVRFLKRVSDATGHETLICQRWFDVDAECEAGAVDEAQGRFRQAERTRDWRLRADHVEAEALDRVRPHAQNGA